MPTVIPKIIMQTWETTEIPKKWKDGPLSVKKQHPDYKYTLLTAEDRRNFLREHFPQYLKLYDSFPFNIQRADFIRYAWLYVNGGYYIDLDYELYKSFHEIISSPSYEVYIIRDTGRYSSNSCMASVPGHPLWLDVMERISKKEIPWYACLGKHVYVLYLTGPKMLINVIKKQGYTVGHFPKQLFPSCNVCVSPCIVPGGRKIEEESSWVDGNGRFFTHIYCNFHIFIGVIILIIIVLLWWYLFYQRG